MKLTPSDELAYFLRRLAADPEVGYNPSLCPILQKLRQLGYSHHQSLTALQAWAKGCQIMSRDLSPEEITRAAASVYDLSDASGFARADPRPWLRPDSKWPRPDPRITEEINASGWNLDTLVQMSGPLPTTPAQVLKSIYRDMPPETLLCMSSGVRLTYTAPVQSWLELLGSASDTSYDQLVPNPMTALEGTSARSGKTFPRTRSNAATVPQFHVVEFDGGSSADQAARIILIQRRTRQELRMVCWSGSKSLHAYFALKYESLQNLIVFYELCCLCGADRRLMQPEQLARMPLGIRANNGTLQKALFSR